MTARSSKPEKKRKFVPDNEETRSDLSCRSCGHVFAAFLKQMGEHNAQQMAEHNPKETTEHHAKVTCPKCGKTHEYSRSDRPSSRDIRHRGT
jgi:DNA-directed RNA polymerase subunit M/transcription elongation factor TFIIS